MLHLHLQMKRSGVLLPVGFESVQMEGGGHKYICYLDPAILVNKKTTILTSPENRTTSVDQIYVSSYKEVVISIRNTPRPNDSIRRPWPGSSALAHAFIVMLAAYEKGFAFDTFGFVQIPLGEGGDQNLDPGTTLPLTEVPVNHYWRLLFAFEPEKG